MVLVTEQGAAVARRFLRRARRAFDAGHCRRAALAFALAIALFAASGSANASRPQVSNDAGMLVLIDGCDGFVAAGGIAPTVTTAAPASWTHNFVADWTTRSQWRFQNDDTGRKTVEEISLDATGRDAAGHSFAISGSLEWHLFANPELWAEDGMVRIRRNDGAVVTGSAVGATRPVFDPIFTVDRILEVSASSCKLSS
jgi:hypothetical protein